VRSLVLRGRRCLVAGLGKSGIAATELLLREGASVVAEETRDLAALDPRARALAERGVRVVRGEALAAAYRAADLVVKSPGVKWHAHLDDARRRGVPVTGEVELCVPWLDAPVAAITGTNGKSTTTALAGHLCVCAGLRTFAGGNLGTPVADHVLSGAPADALVLELSSYQADDLYSFRCDAAAVLNVTPDHLDRYGTMEAYARSKERLSDLVSPAGVRVFNAEDSFTAAMAGRARGRAVTFAHGEPEDGQIRENGGVIVRRGHDGSEERYTVGSRALRGAHNLENAMAAVECARALGAPRAAVQKGLDTYPGLPHRIEVVGGALGVEWVNDSKGTNVDSVEKSLQAFPGPLHLVMGGRGKGSPYAPLRRLFPGRVARLYVVGEDAARIRTELGDLAPTEDCGVLAEAVRRAARLARPGETVLLSPACASWDQYRDFEQRGDEFRALVAALEEKP